MRGLNHAPYLGRMIVRVMAVSLVIGFGATAQLASACPSTRAEAQRYVREEAPDAEREVFKGLEAERFRVIFNSTDPVNKETGEVFHITHEVSEVHLYWLGELALAHFYDDGCAWGRWIMKRHVAEWYMHRMYPDEWPVPPEHRSDGT